MPVLISPADLRDLLRTEPSTVVLDVRWTLAQPDGRPAYRQGHIPGAVYVDLDSELAGHGAPTDGRHPLPEPADLERSARRWGIDPGDVVVVYDGAGNLSAARAWWLLRHAGLPDVRILDGALPAWTAAGHPTETGDEQPRPGTVTLAWGGLATTDLDHVAGFAADGRLLDVRAGERYRGETEPVDPRAGHIPGAANAPTGGNLDADGRFLSPAALAERYTGLGLPAGSEVAVYCGSGVTASHAAAALTLAGYSPVLYPGSWSQWSNHPDRPVATSEPADARTPVTPTPVPPTPAPQGAPS